MKHEHMIAFRIAQIWALCKLSIAFLIALFYNRRKPIWIIAERGEDARDNGYWFFLYMRGQHPEEEVYYVISEDSVDRARLSNYEHFILNYRSMRHYIMLWRATYLVSTHLQGYFPYRGLGAWIKSIMPYYDHKKHINIKHGITLNHIQVLEYDYARWNLIIAGTKPEYDFFINEFKYPSDHVALTGFARFDNLKNMPPKRQLLLMPTWREWIYKDQGFEKTEYAQKYAHLLSSIRLNKLLEDENIDLIFYPHHEIQRYISFFEHLNVGRHVIIADKSHYDVQQLLKESSLLITDYSSVAFDFAYMRKPIVYYQFDYKRFITEHYAKGWYDYHNSFADYYTDEDLLIDAIREYIVHNFEVKMKHQKYVEDLFPYHDSHNCERIYQNIINIK